ncbi:MAG: phytanoyl-CoA dioxygenase family protein [Phycisphaeraceae bacterium]|nr:phytanoyl-CoA dioxygenase family protein [Phycisphaeraceae bacterium]
MPKLSPYELEHFHREGYLVGKNIIPPSYIYELQAELTQLIDATARKLHRYGYITDLCEDLDFLHRLTELHKQANAIVSPILNHGSFAGPAMFRLLTCPELLDVVEQLVGPEIEASSVYRIRPKLPFRPEGVVPWHQDQGYFHSIADDKLVVTCWLPLMNATVETGCMEVIPRSHRQGVVRHYWANNPAPPLTIHPDHLPWTTPVPVPADIGDVVLMTNLTMHRSTENTSGLIRWATDLRYESTDVGDFYPYEAAFIARSRKHPEQVLTDPFKFNELRTKHVPKGTVDRTWLYEDNETFINPPKK